MPKASRQCRAGTRAPCVQLLAIVGLVAAPTSSSASLAEGDRAWDARAESLVEERATPERIDEAIRHYRAALDRRPGSFEAGWKLLRSLHYAIDFTDQAETQEEPEQGGRMIGTQ